MLPQASPESVTLDVLFPEDYAKSARMVRSDFLLLGSFITFATIGAVMWLNAL